METYDANKNTTEVRQASRRLGNFWVLIVSVVVLVAAFAIIYFVYAANTPTTAM